MSPEERAIRYARLPGVTVAAACRRFGTTRARFYAARRRTGAPPLSVEDLVLASMLDGAVLRDLDGLAAFIDYVDHARPAAGELDELLARLVRDGKARVVDGGWALVGEWP